MEQPELDLKLQEKQGQVLLSKATEILYGGAAGGGKSHAMRIIAILIASIVPGVQIYLFRRHFPDLYKNHMEGPTSLPALLYPLISLGLVKINGSDHFIEFWNGSKIFLCHLQHPKDLLKYQGPEIHVLLMDELTHFDEKEYRFLRNRVRLGGLKIPDDLEIIPGVKVKDKLPMILSGTNPGSRGHAWVKRTFIDFAHPMEVHRTRRSEGGMLRTFIPALLEDNKEMMENDPGYEDRLFGLNDPILVKAMRYGDWNIVAGGALDDVWSEERMIPRFNIPKGWKVDRSFDWGSTHPFSVGWWATSNGEEIEVINKVVKRGRLITYRERWVFPEGSLIRINEWYGTKEVGSNEGLKLTPNQIAQGILEKEKAMLESGFIQTKVQSGPADGQIFNNTRRDIKSIADTMADMGIYWNKADKSPGSRINGLQLLRDRLVDVEGPGIYFMRNCRAAATTLPVLPRDENNPEDVDTNSEDHVYDEVRYRVLQQAADYATKIKVRNFGS